MSVYNIVFADADDHQVRPVNNATYSTWRGSSGSTTTTGATTLSAGQGYDFGGAQYGGQQAFLTFDTSAIAGSVADWSFNAKRSTSTSAIIGSTTAGGLATAHVLEWFVHAWSSAQNANFRTGTQLAALTPIGSGTIPATASVPFSLSGTGQGGQFSASATFRIVIASQDQRLDVEPSTAATNGPSTFFSADQAGTTDDPYLLLEVGTAGWEFVGVSGVVEVTGTSHALTEPAGVQEGDLLVAMISSRIASTTAITLPSGGEWTLVSEQKNSNTATNTSATPSGMMAYCVRGASAPNLTFTHPTNPSVALGRIAAYRNVDPSSPKDTQTSFTTATNTTAVSGTGLTTTQDDDLIVAMAAGGQEASWSSFAAATDPTTASGASNTTSHPAPNAWIERADSNTTTGADTSLGVFDAVKTAAGVTGNLTATASQGAAHVVVAGAFKLAAPAAATERRQLPVIRSHAVMRASLH